MYALEHRIARSIGVRQGGCWQSCAFCGNAQLLLKICAAQPDSQNWRVVKTAHLWTEGWPQFGARRYRSVG